MTTDDLVRALEETWEGIHKLIAEVQDDEWSLRTPCTEWDVHDLVAHLGAVESRFQGLPQPETEAPAPTDGIDAWTAAGVRARRAWGSEQLRQEVEAASEVQLEHLRSLEGDAWAGRRMGPLGETTEERLAMIRVFDLYLHLLDLRTALGRPLAGNGEPTAARVCSEWVLEITPWGAAAKAGLGDGARVRLDLSSPAARRVDVVVEANRGRLNDPEGEPTGSVSGPALAYVLTVTGRQAMAEAAGGLTAEGADAHRLLEGFRVFE